MGLKCSRPAANNYDDADGQYDDDLDDIQQDEVQDLDMFDKQYIRKISKDLRDSPQVFVLNNVLMSEMFFQNYKKDMDGFLQRRLHEDLPFVSPDIVLEKVYENVRFRPFHGPKKEISEPISNQRLFVFNDIVKVIGSSESVEDVEGNCDKPIVRIEESQRKGFVKLREIETTPITSDQLQIPISCSEPTSRSSTDSDSTNAYSTSMDMKTPKPLEILRGLENRKHDFIHSSCIAHRRIKKKASDLYLEDRSPDDISEEEFYETVSYISSRGYMKYFQNNLFPSQIAKQIGLTDEELLSSQSIPGRVFCVSDGVPIDVIPAIPADWPAEQTFSFSMKSEQEIKYEKYRFPTRAMIDDIKKFKCALVPRGYFKKRGDRIDSDIEWELCFPQAQRYLESYMSHAQLKCMLFLLTIHKTFIEPKTSQHGLLPEHIRCFMLWECESNYNDWPEHRLGSKLMTVIKNLNEHIAKAHLPDYFIAEKNMLENIKKKYLRFAQKVFHDILESPLMNFIRSLRSLRYTNGRSFYPPFDFESVYEMVIKLDFMANPDPNNIEDNNNEIPKSRQAQKILDAEIQLKLIQEAKQRSKVLNDRMGEKRESVDSINVDWNCEKEFDVQKKRRLLTLFINTFLQIAKKCTLISSKRQTQFYLKQARYLTMLMKEHCAAFEDEARYFIDIIRNEEAECERWTEDSSEPSRVGFESHVLRKLVENNSYENDNNVDKNTDKLPARKSVTFEVEVHKVDIEQVF